MTKESESAPIVRRVSVAHAVTRTSEILDVYAEAFGGPPWCEGAEAVAAHRPRLLAQLGHPRAEVVLAEHGERLVGAAFGWAATDAVADDHLHRRVRRALGAEAARRYLAAGVVELAELMVRAGRQGRGLGGALMDCLLAGRPTWLLTHRDSRAIAFYERAGCRDVAELVNQQGVPLVIYVRD